MSAGRKSNQITGSWSEKEEILLQLSVQISISGYSLEAVRLSDIAMVLGLTLQSVNSRISKYGIVVFKSQGKGGDMVSLSDFFDRIKQESPKRKKDDLSNVTYLPGSDEQTNQENTFEGSSVHHEGASVSTGSKNTEISFLLQRASRISTDSDFVDALKAIARLKEAREGPPE
jgi:hypothetical protein